MKKARLNMMIRIYKNGLIITRTYPRAHYGNAILRNLKSNTKLFRFITKESKFNKCARS